MIRHTPQHPRRSPRTDSHGPGIADFPTYPPTLIVVIELTVFAFELRVIPDEVLMRLNHFEELFSGEGWFFRAGFSHRIDLPVAFPSTRIRQIDSLAGQCEHLLDVQVTAEVHDRALITGRAQLRECMPVVFARSETPRRTGVDRITGPA